MRTWPEMVRVSATTRVHAISRLAFCTKTSGSEGLDVNNESDLWHANYLIELGEAVLPAISLP